MSEPISTSSPRAGSISDDGSIFAFDGAEALLRAWGGGLKPDPLLTVSEWADRYRTLSSRAAAEPGRYRTKRTPYMKEIMDALSPGHPAQRVVFMKAAQVGATEAGNCFLGFIIHQAPGPALAVQPTVELAKRNSRQRIDPLIEESAGAAGQGEAGALARRRQHHAVEGVRRRHPDHDRRQLGGRAALDPGALHLPRRGRRLSGLGRRGRRSGLARRGAVADLRAPAQGVPGLDADDPRPQPHRARVRGERPAAVLRGLPALRHVHSG